MSITYLDLSNYKNKLQLDREDHLAESVISLTDKQKLSIYKKSQKSGYSTDILEEVYRRGHMIWKADLFEGTREQFAFDRVNSFISGGFATDLDSDLLDESKGLWSNIHAKRERIKSGSGERMRKPGSKGAPSKEAIKSAQNEELELEESESALAKKAKASGVSLGTLKKVYARGVAAWRTGHRPGTTPQQWGMARVNSYITKGKGTYHGADKDLREASLPEVPKDKETGLPKKYTTGEKGTDQARASHFAKGREKHWDDPSAYEKAPGDATAETKESKHTKKYRQMYGEEYTGSEKVSKDKNASSSRFIGTKSLSDIYKKDTPGEIKTESTTDTIKRVITETKICEDCDCGLAEEVLNERGADSKGYYRSTESGAGLTAKGAKHFGIKTAVTTPPSKLKKGSKAAKRRKSFCARMGGMRGPMKDEKGRPTRKAMSLRRWNC